MAEFEVFVPVQGEYIVTVEANSAEEAMRLITDGEIDFSEGEPNVEWNEDDAPGFYAVLVDGAEGDLDDDDDAETLLLNGVTLDTETGLPYIMRHYRL